jgi:catechol 2,3-dioxygenase-like lactoylglutathione lyase family enzyme
MPPLYVRSYGLTHIALSAADPKRSAAFYSAVLRSRTVHHDAGFVRIETPGARDVTMFEHSFKGIGRLGGMAHFGFQLQSPDEIVAAIDAVKAAGGEVVDHGELVPGEPYLFARDLDGYMFEIWYELPATADPATGP